MEFYHLRSFVVVAKTKNLTSAAKQLCTTPPSISAHIKSLEEELRTPLFVRSNKGMELTDKGEALLIKAQKTLDSAVEMVNLAAINENEVIGRFRLSMNQSSKQLRVFQLIENIKENIQGVDIELHAMATGQALNEMRNNRIDGGYIYGEVPDDFYGIKVNRQQITTIAPKQLIINESNSESIYFTEPWITMGSFCPFDTFLSEKLPADVKKVTQSSDDNSRLSLVEQGVGLSFLEREAAELAEQAGKVQILSQFDFEADLSFVVLKERVNDPVVKAMLQEVQILWNIKS